MRFRFGMSHDPTQKSLDQLFGKVTRARVLDGGVFRGKALGSGVLLEVSTADELDSLRDRMSIIEDRNTFCHCLCLGDQALEFYAGRRRKAIIGLHHGRSLRWDGYWRYDALLSDGRGLLAWLADRGVEGPLAAYEESERRAEEYRQAARSWRQSMPECLRPFWDSGEMQVPDVTAFVPYLEKQESPPDSSAADSNNSLAPLLKALAREYPDETARLLALFAWFGSGEGKWSGFPSYESVAEMLLLTFPTGRLVAALTGEPLTPAHLEGAARYFSGYWFNTSKQEDAAEVPPGLKKQLLSHCLASNDQYKLRRAQKVF
ncbi:MAG: hypothetical protein AAB281_01825 [Actinomycetota bacterium]